MADDQGQDKTEEPTEKKKKDSRERGEVAHSRELDSLAVMLAASAAVAAWTDGAEWLAAVMEVLDENRHRLVDLLAEHLPGSRYRMPDATYLAWIDCSHLGEGAVPRDIFRERGVEVSPGPQFGSEGSGHVRLNMATSPAVLERIVTAMGGG